jgi:hypothetical protein
MGLTSEQLAGCLRPRFRVWRQELEMRAVAVTLQMSGQGHRFGCFLNQLTGIYTDERRYNNTSSLCTLLMYVVDVHVTSVTKGT